MDAKTKIDIAEVVLKYLAAAAAGIWAFWLLIELKQREQAEENLRKTSADRNRAEADVRKIERDLRELERTAKQNTAEHEAKLREMDLSAQEAQLRLRLQAIVTVSIEPTILPSPDGGGYVILAVVGITNRGNRNTLISWMDELPAFYVRQVEKFGEHGEAVLQKDARTFRVPATINPNVNARSHVIRVGSTETIPFAVHVKEKGLYLLSFRGAVAEEERAEAKRLGVKAATAWTANKYVLVSDAPSPVPVSMRETYDTLTAGEED